MTICICDFWSQYFQYFHDKIEKLLPVFQIFDDDGDGLLSYQEFVAMMKDRIHRGLKSYSRCKDVWTGVLIIPDVKATIASTVPNMLLREQN